MDLEKKTGSNTFGLKQVALTLDAICLLFETTFQNTK